MARGSSGSGGKTKAQRVTDEVSRAVGAGRAIQVETVDFNDPNRPKTCLEVDFPILPVNQVAAIEGKGSGALKPVYQVSKWWARRRSSVFRSLLLSAAMKAPEDASQAAKAVWDVYYANHQKKRSFANLKVADIFMGGGTTIVEGSRLGMRMFGNDLNPVAWFVVKTELAQVKKSEVEALLADIEAEVKPQLMPFYACSGPNNEQGTWKRISTGEALGESFDALALKPTDRKDLRYEGPESIYVFWARHGPCQVTGCSHSTPIMTSPLLAAKEVRINAWLHVCPRCKAKFDIEECEARMAPDVPLIMSSGEAPFAVLRKEGTVSCPSCGSTESFPSLGKPTKKRVLLSLLVQPDWLRGGPSPQYPTNADDVTAAEVYARWVRERCAQSRLLEVRGKLPAIVTCPETGTSFSTIQGTVPKKSHFTCGACGTVQDLLSSVRSSGRAGPFAPYAIQGFSARHEAAGGALGGRFFLPANDAAAFVAAFNEWGTRREGDLAAFWPRSAIPFGHEAHQRRPLDQHGYARWVDMFNSRQLLVHALLLKSICEAMAGRHSWECRELLLAAFQQYLRNQNMFCFWNIQRALEPMFSNNNLHPKNNVVENTCFSGMGRGDFKSCVAKVLDALEWKDAPWDIASDDSGQHSEKVVVGDCLQTDIILANGSATDLRSIEPSSYDLVITDPPFGDNIQYAELSDLFYVWLRLALREKYPKQFDSEFTPKALEAVSNRARQPEDADGHYQRLLTASWMEANYILRPGGILAFTFHHSADAPWVAVLESLFNAGFYLEATFPIRSDETKGDGQFGSQKIEHDIVHVCRKRTDNPVPVSWAKMRRQVLQDVRALKDMLEHHQKAGLPDADLQVIRRGKALEYFSRHYGKVLLDDGRPMSVLEALVGINQLLDEEMGGIKDPPPVTAEPFTRQFLRLFDGVKELPRDQMQKFLRGTGIAPSDFETRGWCAEAKKVYQMTSPLEVARAWQGKHRRGMTSDYDQAAFLIGACFENSGINATDTLANSNFRPHPALGALLEWFATRGATSEIRNAASRAQTILRSWRAKHEKQDQQMSFFFDDQGAA